MTRRLTALCLALVLSITLSACWESEPEPDDAFWGDDPTQSDETPEKPPVQIAVFTLPCLSGQTLDPVTCIDGVQQTVGALLYEGLFALDDTFTPQPVLCESYQYNAATLTYTFTLCSGVTFSDGSTLTAADVLATYRRAAESERYGARFAQVTAMRAVSTTALTVTLARANEAFPALLDIPIVKSGTEKNLVPAGTGPYYYVTDAGGEPALLASPSWRGGALPLSRIALSAVKDNDTALSLFATHTVHLLRLDPTGTGVRTVGGAVQLTSVPTTVMQFLGFNVHRAPLANGAVRRAMSGMLDRATMTSSLLSGHGAPAQFPVSPLSSAYPRGSEFRMSAKDYAAALEGAGVTASRPRSLTLLVNEENSFKRAIAESVCTQLSTDALTVSVRALPWEDYLAALESGSFDLYLGETRLSADWNAGALLETDGALNFGGYEEETLAAHHAAFLATGSAAYFAAFANETPFAPLLFKSEAILTPTGLVEGVTPSPSNVFAGLEGWIFHLSDTTE